jgi:3-oxoacyl-[acyl-carrier protein] reductase
VTPAVPTAIVTGAARGIGEAIARRLHADGYRVVLADLDLVGAERVASGLGGGALAIEHDVREQASWERLRAGAGEDVYALVNNAARTELRSFFDVDVSEWDDVLATNLRGTYLGCRAVGERLRDSGGGRIVNLASDAGQNAGGLTGPHYAASKAAIIALTRRAATELAPHGVTVNAVAPAAIAGPQVDDLPPGQVQALAEEIPVRRLGRPEEVAALVAFLLSDDAGYVTGATLDVNGGVVMR